MKNITLSVDERVLASVRRYATACDSSVNGLVREYLTRMARREDHARNARQRIRELGRRSRSGKRHTLKSYPWGELRIAGQWILELVILRLLGYTESYSNRTRLTDVDPNERVPWT